MPLSSCTHRYPQVLPRDTFVLAGTTYRKCTCAFLYPSLPSRRASSAGQMRYPPCSQCCIVDCKMLERCPGLILGAYAGRSGKRTDGGLRASRSPCIDYAQSSLLVTPTRCSPRGRGSVVELRLIWTHEHVGRGLLFLAVVQALLLYGAFLHCFVRRASCHALCNPLRIRSGLTSYAKRYCV